MNKIMSGTLLALALAGCGGGDGSSPAATAGAGTGGAATTPPTTTTPSGAPELIQFNTHQTSGTASENNSVVSFTAATKAGDTIWVAVTLSDFGGAHTETTVTDTQGNTYTKLDQVDAPSPGDQTVAHFYAANIAGDTGTPDTITVNWGSEDYKGVLIAEISGVTAAPLIGHTANMQTLGTGTDNVKAGPFQVSSAQTPALILALSMNTSGGQSNLGGSGASGPVAGSGLTQQSVLFNYGANLATFATGTVTSAESVTALFSASTPTTDLYVTVAAVFH